MQQPETDPALCRVCVRFVTDKSGTLKWCEWFQKTTHHAFGQCCVEQRKNKSGHPFRRKS